MQEGTIGRRYARALAGSIGDKQDVLQQVDAELSALRTLMEDKTSDLRQAMLNPSFRNSQRQQILSDIVKGNKFHAATDGFLRLIVEKERLPYLALIARCFSDEVDERVGRVRATITSAKALDDGAMKSIIGSLEKRTGKTVLPEATVDASVISGISARIGGLVFDGTLRSQLERLKADLR